MLKYYISDKSFDFLLICPYEILSDKLSDKILSLKISEKIASLIKQKDITDASHALSYHT